MWLTVKETSTKYNIKTATLYKWARNGEIPHYRIGSLVRFKSDEVGEWLLEHRHEARSEAEEPKLSLEAPSRGYIEPRDIARNAIDEVLGSGYNPSQRGNQTIKPGKEGS